GEARERLEAAVDGAVERLAVAAQRVAETPQVLDNRHGAEHGPSAGDLGNAEAQAALGVEERDVGTAESHAPARRQADAGDELEERRLPGSVHTEEGDHLAVVDGEVHAEQHL